MLPTQRAGVLRLLALTIMLLATAATLEPCGAAQPERKGWRVGVGYGPGRAKIEGSDSLTTDWLDGPTQFIQVGRMLNRSVRIGYEHQAWLREQGFHDLKIRAGVQLEAIGVTAYPGPTGNAWRGLFVSAGGGYAHARLTFLEPLAPGESAIGDTYEEIFKEDDFGWGWYGALGYEFAISRTFSAGATLSYHRVDLDGSAYDHAQVVPLVASLSWSF